MKEWKGPMEDIRRACERWGIDTESKEAMSCSTCLHFKDDYNHSFDYLCRVCDRNSMGDMFVPWTPHFGEWVPVDKCLPDNVADVLITYYFGEEAHDPDVVKMVKESPFYKDAILRLPHITIAAHSDDDEHWVQGDDCIELPDYIHVTAWMPLPEPYKGGGDDD